MKTKSDKEKVLRRGPYTIYWKPMFLHEWKPNFNLKEDTIRMMPIWVNFHQLPLIYWGECNIWKIASAISKPMMTNECTTKKLWVSYARVLIEVDITTELKETITIRGPQGNKPLQPVEYEWKPPFFKAYNRVGHDCKRKKYVKKETTQVKKKWIARQHPIEKKEEAYNITNEQEEHQAWTAVGSSNRSKGKGHMEEEVLVLTTSVPLIGCRNGFEILGDKQGLSGIYNPWFYHGMSGPWIRKQVILR